ncbi:hypothetical protein CDL15_Pgr010418 [Punica granatum]|uniref:Subtilisin-like protease SBT4.3 n=1 Tax=Punica granatum TaxID=22663 RepID=A0A218W2A4_PUNGR|nr:hypothetical protein CDL15_Pgr010418 [Punica granatum]
MAAKDALFKHFCILSVVFLLINHGICLPKDEDRKVYIVYLGSLNPTETYSPTSQHLSLLQQVVKDQRSASASLIRSYKRSFNGFAAKLTEKEAQKLASKDEVFSVFPSQTFYVQTTKSWDFIGLSKTAKRMPSTEGNIIIAVLDSGAYPESESFSDKGFGPPPRKWKGSCKGGSNFTCNNKLIGARNYVSDEDSALDGNGHGTHTASTAAGNAVEGASFFGIANGTARGGVQSSRIAIYKVCDSRGHCDGDGILAAFDDAIADGVDIITVSLGNVVPSPFNEDPFAIGAFHATSKGILVTQAAGNLGPSAETVTSVAPWILTVAASTVDRLFITKLVLGNGTVITGIAVNSFPSALNYFPLVFGKQVSSSCGEASARACYEGCLEMQKVAGKIVICEGGLDAPSEAAAFGARGIILKGADRDDASAYPLPAVALDDSSFEKLLSYHNSTKDPQGRILKGETTRDAAAPAVPRFSSRGPNAITPDIMKPDVSAPGANILAAFPPNLPPTPFAGDDRRVKFLVKSGTSMSCPHVAGAAAYVKTFHPDWSPSAVKSALMTTASKLRDTTTRVDLSGREFSYGSGQINPLKAVDPGLVYETTKADYVNLLCSLGYDIRSIDSNGTCPKGAKNITEAELNYPSLTFKAPVSEPFELAINRTVTNVGPPNSTYKAKVDVSPNINITVVPEVISFESVSEKKSFTIGISASGLQSGALLSNEVVWSDGVHHARSPVIVYTEQDSPE